MSRPIFVGILLALAWITPSRAATEPEAAQTSSSLHHDLVVDLSPERHDVSVVDRMTLPDSLSSGKKGRYYFVLHAGMEVSSSTEGVRLRREKRAPRPEDLGLASDAFEGVDLNILDLYSLKIPAKVKDVTIEYRGSVHHPLAVTGEEYARDFQETPGLISEDGVYLSGSSHWVPWFGESLVTFTLEVTVPGGWGAVSQGVRTLGGGESPTGHESSAGNESSTGHESSAGNESSAGHESSAGSESTAGHDSSGERRGAVNRIRWESPEAQDEIFLVAGPWTEYREEGEGVEAFVFLRTPDPALAGKYLDATKRYLEMYDYLIGPYPYKKFALVENFWETGYGMPSFTLLGPKIIRFPFILTSSYPHEILHNWWGNSVYVDYRTGNWCEGLTAYLADHLIQEQRGAGADYREGTLQKYTDYAARAKDFPLTMFRERHSSATEAVGYGKALMFYHMLRLQLGDETFVKGLQTFYKDNMYREAGFVSLRRALEAAAGQDLALEFDQWVARTGAPRLRLGEVKVSKGGEGARPALEPDGVRYHVTLFLEQTQEGPLYRLNVPIAVTLEGQKKAYQTVVNMETGQQSFELDVEGRPLRLDVDPEFDVFRILDPNETPPALSGVFGAEKILALIPAEAPEPLRDAYRGMAEFWQQGNSETITIRSDADLEALPEDRAVWVFGWENRFAAQARESVREYDVTIDPQGVHIGRTEIPREGHSVVLAGQRPGHPELGIAFVASDLPGALPGLGRKLPHYHKYSYLGFEGLEPTNMAKGRWPVIHSPLTRFISWNNDGSERAEQGSLAARSALAEMRAVFSDTRMMETVQALSSPELEGRGFGSPGLDKAADYIANAFREAGLKPAGDQPGSYFRTFTATGGEPASEATLKNVVGVLPGKNADWSGQSVVVGAHYDHLGLGWPEDHAEDKGQVHPGADDNASGVAVLLEVARALKEGAPPDRDVVFVAFSGEEAGLLGSVNYVANARSYPMDKCTGMINIDTVGRLEGRKLLVLGAGSAREWIHIFMGVGYTTGVKTEVVAKDFGSSDQKSFLDAGVPAVQLFGGPHLDYHRPTDTADKIDPQGLVQTATVVKEVAEYLAGREEPMTVTLAAAQPGQGAEAGGPAGQGGGAAGQPGPASGGRKVSLGTVPDFAFPGPGVRLTGVVPGSPADSAGLKEGDVVVKLNGADIADLRGLSDVLKGLEPGDAVTVTFVRDGAEQTASTKVEAR